MKLERNLKPLRKLLPYLIVTLLLVACTLDRAPDTTDLIFRQIVEEEKRQTEQNNATEEPETLNIQAELFVEKWNTATENLDGWGYFIEYFTWNEDNIAEQNNLEGTFTLYAKKAANNDLVWVELIGDTQTSAEISNLIGAMYALIQSVTDMNEQDAVTFVENQLGMHPETFQAQEHKQTAKYNNIEFSFATGETSYGIGWSLYVKTV